MKQELQLKLQAHLDGELPDGEAQAVKDLIAHDVEARDLLGELTQTRDVLAGHEVDLKVPATREFYWSQIRRGIERQEKTSAVPASESSSLTIWWRRLLPASGLVAVLLAVALAGYQFHSAGNGRLEHTQTTFSDAGAFTYRDYASGTTLVWLDYPAENEFTTLDGNDTLGHD